MLPPWPEGVDISVYNPHEEAWEPRGLGKDFSFPAQAWESINPEEAFFLWGIETRLTQAHGVAMIFHPDARRECLMRWGLTSPEGQKWFNAFKFKLVKQGKRGSRENWAKLMALSEL